MLLIREDRKGRAQEYSTEAVPRTPEKCTPFPRNEEIRQLFLPDFLNNLLYLKTILSKKGSRLVLR